MANTTLNTVIKLRYDSYENWQANSTVVLQAGEAGICTIPADTGTGLNEPATLMKIGNGTSTWAQLPWVSGLAADVIPSLKGSNPTLPVESVTGLDDYLASHGAIDTDTQYQIVKEGNMGIKLQSRPKTGGAWNDVGTITLSATTEITTAIQALDAAAVTAGAGEIISEVSQADGVVSAKKRALAAADIPTLTTAKLSDFATAVDGRIDTKVGNIGESADVAEFVGSSIETTLGTLQDNGQTAGTGEVISAVSQADGVISVQKKTLVEGDIPSLSISKITDLQTTLDGKQATVVWNTAYNASTNKAATMADVNSAVSGLSGAMHFVGVSTTNPATGTVTIDDNPDYSPAAGDVVIYEATHKEYVYDGKKWVELGDESSYAVKGAIKNADIAADAAIDQSKIANLTTDLASKATPADITAAIQNLDKAAVDVAVGYKISQIEEVDGIINVSTSAITANDIPELPQSKITGLSTALAGKQDAVTFDGTYNAESNKAATVSTVTNAIGALDFDDTAVAHEFITEVNETNGVISVQRAVLVADDIPDLTASKITDLGTTITNAINTAIGDGGAVDTAVDAKLAELDVEDSAVATQLVSAVSQADGKISVTRRALVEADIPTIPSTKVSGLGYFATGTDATNLTLAAGNYLILNGGGAAGFGA